MWLKRVVLALTSHDDFKGQVLRKINKLLSLCRLITVTYRVEHSVFFGSFAQHGPDGYVALDVQGGAVLFIDQSVVDNLSPDLGYPGCLNNNVDIQKRHDVGVSCPGRLTAGYCGIEKCNIV